MFFDLNKKDYVIIVIVLALCIVSTVLLNNYVYKQNKVSGISKNSVNEYSSNYITNDKQASIYLSRFYNLLNNSISEAYKKLDTECKKHFSNEAEFRYYINSLNISNSNVVKLKYYEKNDFAYYDVIDTYGNHFTFKTRGVMNYTVIVY